MHHDAFHILKYIHKFVLWVCVCVCLTLEVKLQVDSKILVVKYETYIKDFGIDPVYSYIDIETM